MTSSRLALVPVALAVGALAAGCGSSNSSSTTSTTAASSAAAWADGVCGAIGDWQSAVKTSADGLKTQPSKTALQDTAKQMKDATDTLAQSLRDLGRPDLPAASQAKSTVDKLATQIEDGVSTMESTVSSSSGVVGLANSVSAIGTTVAKLGTDVSTAVTDLQNLDAKGELHDAFAQSTACQQLSK